MKNIYTYIKDNISILDVVGDHVKGLFKIKSYWGTLCPFCEDTKTNFRINHEKGIFYCFGCHATGDSITFIEKIKKCNALEAAYDIIDKFQFSFHPDDLKKIQEERKKDEPAVQEN